MENFRRFVYGSLFTFVLLGLISFVAIKIDEYNEMKRRIEELEERLEEFEENS